MTTYLGKLKKTELVELSEEAGLSGSANLKKEDLITELEAHLRKNSATLSSKSAFAPFYKIVSPAKKETTVTSESEASKAAKARKRTTKGPGELTTPKAVQRVAAKVPLPPSPSAVTDLVERQTAAVTRRFNRYWSASGVEPYADAVRQGISNAVAVGFIIFALEAWGLQRVTLPWRHAFVFSIPFAKELGLGWFDKIAVFFPDFFVLLTGSFWAPSTLWSFTNIIIPAAAGGLCNFTIHAGKRRAYDVDPLIFYLTKALVSWLVYAEGVRFYGAVSEKTVRVVAAALPGGWFGIVIGSLCGVCVSLYEAVLRK